jgi:murein DD-endopeptidase MepM/ murein hydrolase activator NlpD
MPVLRQTARPFALVVLASAVLATAHASAASRDPSAQIIFPVIGAVSYRDDFGEPRAQGGHPGNDILADRHADVVAVEAGRIVFWTSSASAGCMLYLYGRSGTTYQYIHLNNDLTARNDNRGSCVAGVSYAPGLRDGQTVTAGELIGYVGDSGDANGLHPHMHFEVHPGGGKPVSPFAWLQRAQHLPAPLSSPSGGATTVPDLALAGDQVRARGLNRLYR